MAWFTPKTLLDDTYEVGILIKGVDGVIEVIGGILLLIIHPSTIDRIVDHIETSRFVLHTQHHFGFIIGPILRYGNELASGHNGFAAAFLLSHGGIKIILIVALLRNKLWAYPFSLAMLGLFIVYQVYRIVVHPTFGMEFLTVVDLVIVWLIWREWQKQKEKWGAKPSNAGSTPQ